VTGKGAPALVAVLAGGASRRMGTAKTLVPLAGRPLVLHPLAAAAAAGLRAVVVAKAATPLPPVGVEVWLEPDEPQHPLLGIVTALERAGGPVVAAGCDQPWLEPELLRALATADGPAAARVDGRLEPLPARYEPAALPALRAALDARAPLREAVAGAAPVDVEARVVASVNTPEDALAR
jgi:molybdopterin-guanine dinucleotide biosynthesis protein A